MGENNKSDFDSIFELKGERGDDGEEPLKEVKEKEKPPEETEEKTSEETKEEPTEQDDKQTADDLFKEFRKDLEDDENLMEEKDKVVSEFDEIKKEVEPPKKEPGVEEKNVSGEQAGIVLREGHIEIPSDSNVRLIRKDGKISVVVGKGTGEMGIDGELIDLSKLTSGEDITLGGGEESDVEDILKSIQESGLGEGGWVDESEGDEFIGEIRDDINLLDLRKEFMEKEEEEEEFDDEFEEEEGVLDRIKRFVKKTAVEGREEKLVRLSMENLDKTGGMRDQRKATVAVACVLKEFLQIKFDINRELTYIELIKELREREMDKKLRDSLIRFFKSTSIMMYANIGGVANYNKALNLAKSAVKELS
ncbi:MAG: hypothetical protein U9M95_05985 [Candidatus Altiarchaeota archaeon]|nr:hypothetical protein [Candidatus Altiarchaeota archaeon]